MSDDDGGEASLLMTCPSTQQHWSREEDASLVQVVREQAGHARGKRLVQVACDAMNAGRNDEAVALFEASKVAQAHLAGLQGRALEVAVREELAGEGWERVADQVTGVAGEGWERVACKLPSSPLVLAVAPSISMSTL